MITKEQAYTKITSLVDRFEEQKEFYRRSEYNETLTRRDFIDPMFKALGWDIDNEQGYAESYREVIHEDRIKVGGATKAPDYSFRLSGGKRLFFVEAKKPSVLIKDEITPAYQVRRYGWSAKLPISIITDFEEFAVYDCTKKPNLTDKASHGRIKYITYGSYLNEFDFLWDTFSKEKVLKGSFDKFVQSDKQKKGTSTVDKEFLSTLDTWRTYLANNIALRNSIDDDELNFVVQNIIDRIIFLRIAEDRGIEPYGSLKDSIKTGEYYDNLLRLFYTADDKYNSGLFDFKKDKISSKIVIDNKIVKTIISDLYYPISPYEFSVISVEILGSAYEQFLGKTISVSKTGRAVIEEKPEVRKAGGVYYTPQYIVDYIVKNTLGKLIEKKTPKEISTFKIVDPACGSGSFLIGAYQYLLQYHKDYYTKNGKESRGGKHNPLTPEGNLTTAEKKRILINNIFGVDLDSNAVEVTKLSLLLKCMEGETEASIATQLKLFHDRILPTLDNNIKSGNSLIDVDLYENEIEFEMERKVRPFSWKNTFPDVFSKGGFDCVVGNPPWGADLSDEVLQYLRKKHHSIILRMVDSYMYFIRHSIDLMKDGGSFGMIIPSTFLNQSDMQLLRKFIADNYNLEVIVNLGEKVFGPKVLNTSTILVFTKSISRSDKIVVGDLRNLDPDCKATSLAEIKALDKSQWNSLMTQDAQSTYFTFESANVILLNKLQRKFKEFSQIIEGEIQRGISPDYAKAFVLGADEAASEKIENEVLRPVVLGKHISRYNHIKSDDVILYLRSKDVIDKFPRAKEHLSKFRKFITCREVSEGKHPWYALHRARNPEIFAAGKFIGLTTTKKLTFVYDSFGYYATDALYVFRTRSNVNEKAILAVLHSKVFQFLYNTLIQGGQRVIPQVKAVNLYGLPFPEMENGQSELANYVDQLLRLNTEKQLTTLPSKIDQIQRRIDFAEQQINKIVYELYGLSEEEIILVENS